MLTHATPKTERRPSITELKTYEEIQDLLKQEPEPRHIEFKNMGGNSIAYMQWANIVNYLDMHAPGCDIEFTPPTIGAGRVYVKCRITIKASDGKFVREAIGTEDDSKKGFGDPSSNASSMALRRAAMEHGFMRNYWTGKGAAQAPQGRRR